MTEEIIIDGIDVSGCSIFNNKTKVCMYSRETCNAICDYGCYARNEIIERLEQDSKQLTQWLDEARRNADFWCNKCTSLEQENKELKEEKLYRGIDRQFIEDANDRLHFEAEKYHKALEEIRKILNKECGVISNAKAVGIINEVLG